MHKKNHSFIWPGLLTVLFLSGAGLARPHDSGLSTAEFKVFADRIEAEVVLARADIETLVPLDANYDGHVSPDEWDRARSNLETLVREALDVRLDASGTAITEPSVYLDESNNFRLTGMFPAHSAKALAVRSLLIKRLPRGHRQFISLLDDRGITLVEALLSAEDDVIDVNLEAVRQDPRAP